MQRVRIVSRQGFTAGKRPKISLTPVASIPSSIRAIPEGAAVYEWISGSDKSTNVHFTFQEADMPICKQNKAAGGQKFPILGRGAFATAVHQGKYLCVACIKNLPPSGVKVLYKNAPDFIADQILKYRSAVVES